MSDMLIDKAYNYIKHGLDMLYIYPNNLSKWAFSNQESMFAYIKKHYKCDGAGATPPTILSRP